MFSKVISLALAMVLSHSLYLPSWAGGQGTPPKKISKPNWPSGAKQDFLKRAEERLKERYTSADQIYDLENYEVNYYSFQHLIRANIDYFNRDFYEQFASQLQNGAVFGMPKSIHYVWVGGPIYKEYWENIRLITEVAGRDGYTVNVWVDDAKNLTKFKQKTGYDNPDEVFPKSRVSVPNEDYERFLNSHPNLHIRNISELRFPLTFMSGPLVRDLWRFIDSETKGLSNYAAASDLIRYIILALEGGLYLDTDRTLLDLKKVFQTHQEQESIIGDVLLPLGFRIAPSNNDVILSNPNHPILVCTLLRSVLNLLKEENYKGDPNMKISNLDSKRLHYKGEKNIYKNYRRGLTIQYSGPEVIQTCVDDFRTMGLREYNISFDAMETVKTLDFNHIDMSYVKPGSTEIKTKAVKSNVIGNCLNLEYKCDNTWLDGDNPKYAFTDDDLEVTPRVKGNNLEDYNSPDDSAGG